MSSIASAGRFVGFVSVFLAASTAFPAIAKDPFPLIVVDKAKNKLFKATYNGSGIELLDGMHATFGKVLGDKQVEKDLKTPEGVYFFVSRHEPPALKPKFGVMGLMVNYPNPLDRKYGKTGYDIMVHATDDPARLERKLDSEGCIVVNNDQIRAVNRHVRLGLSPILIYDELKEDYLRADFRPSLRDAFERWLNAWKTKDIETYANTYVRDFSYNGMNYDAYKRYKKGLNQKYSTIDVKAENVRFYYHPKYDVVTFTQDYASQLKGGGAGFRSRGTKMLYFNKDDQIVVEAYSNLQED